MAEKVGYLGLLRHNRAFRLLWYGQIASQLGDWLDYIALLTLLKYLANSGEAIGGLLVATVYTLFFVPVMYSLLRRRPPAPEPPDEESGVRSQESGINLKLPDP